MGSFDGRCAITNTAIKRGDPVYLVWVEAPRNHISGTVGWSKYNRPSTYQLLSWLSEGKREVERYKKNDNAEALALNGIHGKFGVYNDYGWIEDYIERPEYGDFVMFMVHGHVVDKLLEPSFDRDDDWTVIMVLADFAMLCRLELFDAGPMGSQYMLEEELIAMEMRIELMQMRIKECREYFKNL